jgi:iron-sulfur cluster repair protein YtfE (RIC family)
MYSIGTTISKDATVNEIMRAYPATLSIFNEFGIDSCCGGDLALRIAAARDGVDLQVLLARLQVIANQS